MGGASNTPWTAADDRYLWSQLGHLPLTSGGNLRSNPEVKALVSRLALHFGGRTDSAIRARLKHLRDPNHSAHRRLNGVPNTPMFGGSAQSNLSRSSAPSAFNLGAAPSAFNFGAAPPSFNHAAASPSFNLAAAPSAFGAAAQSNLSRSSSPSAFNLATAPPSFNLTAASSSYNLSADLPSFNLAAAPPALRRGITDSLEMQRAATSLEGQRAAVRSFDSSGRQCCMYCRRLACSTSCPVQQCPLGDRSGEGFTRCRGTTLRGERCKVTSETPRHCGSAPLQLGGQYCEKHTQNEAIAPDLDMLQWASLNLEPGSFLDDLSIKAAFLMRIGGMSEEKFNSWCNENDLEPDLSLLQRAEELMPSLRS